MSSPVCVIKVGSVDFLRMSRRAVTLSCDTGRAVGVALLCEASADGDLELDVATFEEETSGTSRGSCLSVVTGTDADTAGLEVAPLVA